MAGFATALTVALAAALSAGCASVSTAPAEPAPPPVVASPLPAPVVLLPQPEPPAAAAAAVIAAPVPPVDLLDLLEPPPEQPRDLWQRVRAGYALPDLESDLVRKWEQWYARDPAYVQRMVDRGSRYLFHVVEEVQRRGLPTELALLPFIESAFNPQAMSRARASGMWQFMPATGKDFELRQNVFRDDRRDVLASTRAALDYLQRLNGMFDGDWHLALAAYNWGQGNVMRAQERNRRAGLPTGYEDLQMPAETREYVPKLQAVKNIVQRPGAYGLALPPLADHAYFQSVAIDRDIDVALAARLAGLTLEEFQQLNPQLNKPVILAAGTPQVLLPYDNAQRFARRLAAHSGATATWTAWIVPKTLKPAEVARLTGTSEATLREVNLIPPRMLVRTGSTLLVPRAPHATTDVSEHVADNALLSLAPESRPLRRVAFRAGRQGDTVAAVARRYRVSPAQVAQWNGVPASARFKQGSEIVVMLASRAAGRPVGGKVAGRGAASVAEAPGKAADRSSAKVARAAVAARAPVKTARTAGPRKATPAQQRYARR